MTDTTDTSLDNSADLAADTSLDDSADLGADTSSDAGIAETNPGAPPAPGAIDPMAAARRLLGDKSAITGIVHAKVDPTEADGSTITAELLDEDDLFDLDHLPAELTSPFDRPGKWFVVHTQSGYEKKVKQNLEARMAVLDLEDKIHEIEIPMEDVIEFKNGRKVVVPKKIFPGYLLIRCEDSDAVHMDIKGTPGIVGYAGPGGKPATLRRREVESFLQTPEPGEEPQRRTKPSIIYEIDESVRIKDGPFSDFQGQVVEVNEEHLRVKVLVNIFGRETPVELEFAQVAKI